MARRRPTPELHVLLTGGGSGGHVFPALAVAELLRAEGARVSFAGAPDSFEARMVPEHGIDFHALPARALVGRGLLGKLRGLATLLVSTVRARFLVRRLRPSVVLGTGGYASVATVLAAWAAGVPVVLLEPNASPGAANRLLSRVAAGACVAFTEAGRALRCPWWMTGVPVREEFFRVPAALPRGHRLRLLALGGSQGAMQLNELVPRALAALPEGVPPWEVCHQCGSGHEEATRAAYEATGLADRAEVAAFLGDVAGAMAACHLVISRAGAITLAELCAAGRGSILVPLALAEEHQRSNAQALQRAGAARLVESSEATPERLAAILALLLADRARLEGMASAARGVGKPHTVEEIVGHLAVVAL